MRKEGERVGKFKLKFKTYIKLVIINTKKQQSTKK